MFVALPDLDDRRWTDLVDEARTLIPVYGSEWTNHNLSDPGITLVELFAYIAESLVYRANRVPESLKRQFLALAGVRPFPASPARTVVAITPAKGKTVRLPPGVTLSSAGLRFRTMREVTAMGASIRSLHSCFNSESRDLMPAYRRGDPVLPFGDVAAANAFFVLTLGGIFVAGEWLSLYFAFKGQQATEAERERIVAEAVDAACECAGPRNACAAAKSQRRRFVDLIQHHSVRLQWEYLDTAKRWKPLDAVDRTRGFSLNGSIRLRIPDDLAIVALADGKSGASIRCRLRCGEFDSPPAIVRITPDAVAVEQSVAAFEAWTIAKDAVIAGPEPEPGKRTTVMPTFRSSREISKLIFGDTVGPALLVLDYKRPGQDAGSITVQAHFLGVGTAEPFQQFKLQPDTPISKSVHLDSIEQGQWRHWSQRDNFYASKASDANVTLSGDMLMVGDGWHGRTLPEGAPLIASWRSTSASLGNLPTGSSFTLEDSPLNSALFSDGVAAIHSVESATGGSPAETLDHAIGRAIELREVTERAINLPDCERLAKATPGTSIARVSATANVHPRLNCVRAPGVVTLVVVPQGQSARPQPSPGLLSAVSRYVGRRRLIGTRIEVVGPEYRSISVRAVVQAQARMSPAAVQERVVAALNKFFAPLDGGVDGAGWPLGRDVYRSEIFAVIDNIPGVDNVVSLQLIQDDCAPVCGDVCLRPAMLTTPGKQEIEVIV